MSLETTLMPNTAPIEVDRFQAFFEIHVSDDLPTAFSAFVIGVLL